VKSHKQELALADEIIARHEFKSLFQWSGEEKLHLIISTSETSGQLSEEIMEKSATEIKIQPENISESLEIVKEQMMVRDNYKPELFLRELELVEDEICFGFIGSYQKNKYQKFIPNLSFDMASGQFNEYFTDRETISKVDISQFGKKEE
jgi:hypothetical protein